jgi:hypothetical protein
MELGQFLGFSKHNLDPRAQRSMFRLDDFDTPSPASTETRGRKTQILYSEGTQLPEYLSHGGQLGAMRRSSGITTGQDHEFGSEYSPIQPDQSAKARRQDPNEKLNYDSFSTHLIFLSSFVPSL